MIILFTGIIEEIGTVQRTIHRGSTIQLVFNATKIMDDIHIGDSIAVNGVCLTVTEFQQRSFTADVMPETFHATSLSSLKVGSNVNLERAMLAGGRFGGHYVSGHVDETRKILKKQRQENAIYLSISLSEKYQHLILPKGSVAIDGTSLTVMEVGDGYFTIALIPHTAEETVISEKKPNDTVNIEYDLFAKYVFAFSDTSKRERNFEQLLENNGFLS
ncbi:riboflavin synthase [Cytobacillus sp. FSL W7-1323]|uniref:riboflavin synthase n=1 Tax=Cytobacillus sp. FSL W7-1323 TaxID=2921700 RepID=UPI00268ABD43|nr:MULTISPECIES: riboflavin synthase [Cytobacillus]MEA1852694.1 riboflavin synthase [Cytobacillus sp. OWB-43]